MAKQVNKPNWAEAKGQAMAEVSKVMPGKAMPTPMDKPMNAPTGKADMMQGMSDKMDTMMSMMEEMMSMKMSVKGM